MKMPEGIPRWGDLDFRGPCPAESAEQITFFNELRKRHPATWGRIALHPRNEGKRTHQQTAKQKAEGMTEGAPDIVIGGFFCELKRRDHTKCKLQPGQAEYLLAAQQCGYYACLAFGWEAAMEAFEKWLSREK